MEKSQNIWTKGAFTSTIFGQNILQSTTFLKFKFVKIEFDMCGGPFCYIGLGCLLRY